MTKNEYLKELSGKLSKLPREEMLDALAYYSEYFEEAGPENEQEVINKLGNPEDVAKQIIVDKAIKNIEQPTKTVKGGLDTIWIVILAIFAGPIALPLAIALVAIIFAMVVTALSITFSIFVCGISFLVSGLMCLFFSFSAFLVNPVNGIMAVGLGLLLIGLGIVFTVGGVFLVRVMFIGIAKLFKKAIKKEEK